MPLKLLRACISLKAKLQERLLAANSYKKKKIQRRLSSWKRHVTIFENWKLIIIELVIFSWMIQFNCWHYMFGMAFISLDELWIKFNYRDKLCICVHFRGPWKFKCCKIAIRIVCQRCFTSNQYFVLLL